VCSSDLYPVTLLRAAIKAMSASLDDIKAGHHPHERLIDFAELCRVVGFDDYYAEEARYDPNTPTEAANGAANEAAARIAASKSQALVEVKRLAAELAGDTVAKLIGLRIPVSEAEGAVDMAFRGGE
jgi:hypothetical protein